MKRLGYLYALLVALSRTQKRSIILTIDIAMIALAYGLGRVLLVGDRGADSWLDVTLDLTVLMATGTIAIVFLGLHKVKLNAYQMQGVVESALVGGVLAITGVTATAVGLLESPPREATFIIIGMLFLILSVSARLILRRVVLAIYSIGNPRKRILIYGAGQTGQQLAMGLATDDRLEPVAFVDDDRRLQGLTVAGLRVHAPNDLESLIARHGIKRIVLAMPSARRAVRNALTKRITVTGCEVHALPSFADLVTNSAKDLADTRPVDLGKILGRDRLEEELPGVSNTYTGKTILVNGAGGSIGSDICRQLVGCDPRKIVMLDHSELALFEVDRELRTLAPDTCFEPVLGTVCDRGLIDATMAEHDVQIVLHAAAYKHVPMVEQNPLEGIRNNVFGTKCVADAARVHGVERFILVSSDKAVRPKSVMGCSKRFAELIVQDLSTRSTTTCFSMVRFGNVLGSSGSVMPLFHEQIARGGPVTLTHHEVSRYFMTIAEAVRLVLLTGSFARGGDVFVLDMGRPVPIRELARKMIEASGQTVRDAQNPNGDIEIAVTGLRAGEKLHEELLIGSDMLTTPHPKILRAQETHPSEIEMANALQSLRQAIEVRNTDALLETIAKWIETAEDAEALKVNQ